MSWKKRLLKSERAQSALSWLLAAVIRFVYATGCKKRHVDPAAEPYMRGEQNAVFAFWHGRMMLLPCFEPPGRKMRVLISQHRDGKLISNTIGRFGEATVSGSTSRGGQAAVMEMLRALEAGDNISITPDGPRGPLQVAAPGIVTVAKLSGRPVLPVAISAKRHIRFKSWDRFMLALPFSRIAFYAGAPIFVAMDSDEEQARRAIEQAMNALVEQADGAAHA